MGVQRLCDLAVTRHRTLRELTHQTLRYTGCHSHCHLQEATLRKTSAVVAARFVLLFVYLLTLIVMYYLPPKNGQLKKLGSFCVILPPLINMYMKKDLHWG